MEARATDILTFMKNVNQLKVPIYQRRYAWGREQCNRLWEDIESAGKNSLIDAHFLGSVVYIDQSPNLITHTAQPLLIDGQQRLTTITLLLAALAESLGEEKFIFRFDSGKIRDYYLQNHRESGDLRYKLILSDIDRSTLISILDQKSTNKTSNLIVNTYNFFKEKIRYCKSATIENIWKGISKLKIVEISLEHGKDNPQLIFECMNSTGRSLSQSDLIRNFVLMTQKDQESLYKNHWKPIEDEFEQTEYDKKFDSFMRHYLTMKTGTIPKVEKIYDTFKKYYIEHKGEPKELIDDIRNYSQYYSAIALGKELDKDIKILFENIKTLGVEVSYTLILKVYGNYKEGIIKKSDVVEIIRTIESYIFRRAICGIPTNSLNKIFPSITKNIKENREGYVEGIKKILSLNKFPSNREFKEELVIKDIYNALSYNRRKYLFNRLENHDRKEYPCLDDYSIEHIMPQKLTSEWKDDLGDDYQRIHNEYLHTLGNLTLTGYNSKYSNLGFSKKRDMKDGFKKSPLRLNEKLGETDTWDESAIKNRADELSSKAIAVWPSLDIVERDTKKHRSEISGTNRYSIDDFKHLESHNLKNIFESINKEILALNSYVKRECTQRYIAYKADSNFVDIQPMKNCLDLYINMKFDEIHDLHGICEDVSNKRHTGNGDIKIKMRNTDNIEYILDIVKQSLEHQLSDD